MLGAEEGASHTIASFIQPVNSARNVLHTEDSPHVALYCLHGVRYRSILLERAHAEPQRVMRFCQEGEGLLLILQKARQIKNIQQASTAAWQVAQAVAPSQC